MVTWDRFVRPDFLHRSSPSVEGCRLPTEIPLLLAIRFGLILPKLGSASQDSVSIVTSDGGIIGLDAVGRRYIGALARIRGVI